MISGHHGVPANFLLANFNLQIRLLELPLNNKINRVRFHSQDDESLIKRVKKGRDIYENRLIECESKYSAQLLKDETYEWIGLFPSNNRLRRRCGLASKDRL